MTDGQALNEVKTLLKKKVAEHEFQLWCAPLHGWSQKKHDDYHRDRITKLTMAINEVQIQEMVINPD